METKITAQQSITTLPLESRMVHVKRIDHRISTRTRSLTYEVKAGSRIIEFSQQELANLVEVANTFLNEKGGEV